MCDEVVSLYERLWPDHKFMTDAEINFWFEMDKVYSSRNSGKGFNPLYGADICASGNCDD